MSPKELLARHAGDSATCAAITDLVISDDYLSLSPAFRRLILGYLTASARRARRMAWSLRSLLDEPGFWAANQRMRASWIYLFGEEVLEEDATETS